MTAIETSGRDSERLLEEARALAKDYGLGEAVSLRPLPEGYANTNYALETASGTFPVQDLSAEIRKRHRR